tara:strand:- start:271 stop:459 length:189 start_codon:yes stop_codon:yes gene_type:complete
VKQYKQLNPYSFRTQEKLRRRLNHLSLEESGTKNNKNLTDRKKAIKKKRKLAKKMRQKNRRK